MVLQQFLAVQQRFFSLKSFHILGNLQPHVAETPAQPDGFVNAGVVFQQRLPERHGSSGCFAELFTISPNGDACNTENAVAPGVVSIVHHLIGHQHDNAHGKGHRYRKPEDVDERKEAVTKDTSKSSLQIITEHNSI